MKRLIIKQRFTRETAHKTFGSFSQVYRFNNIKSKPGRACNFAQNIKNNPGVQKV